MNPVKPADSAPSGCPASGIENMDPRKFIRMAMLGMEVEFKLASLIMPVTRLPR
ncbi:hypothetical protein [Desulfocastanea catecholica]